MARTPIITPNQGPRTIPSRSIPPYDSNPVYHQQPIAPVHLSASTVIQSGASSGVPVQALQNPMGQDMEILEVKFEISGLSIGDALNATAYPFGGTIACEMKMGSLKVTQGAVPVWNFGRAENLSAETKVDGGTLVYNSYSWRLPRPLFVPAGAVLAPTFNHLGFAAEDLNVRVGYSARTVFKTPRVVYVPWVAGYQSKAFDPISSAGSDSSTAQNLVNDTERSFHLQRFTGRLQWQSPAVNMRVFEEGPPTMGSRYITMRMVDSYGRPIVRTYTPFRSVFGALTRSWELEELGAELDPGAYYRVFLKKEAVTMAVGQDAGSIQAFVSMVGWREEPV